LFIQTEDTPNPNSLKFNPGRSVLTGGEVLAFHKQDDLVSSPFAKRALAIAGVEAVMLAADFITVTKGPDVEWYVLKPALIGLMMEHFVNNVPFVVDAKAQEEHTETNPIIREIREILDTRVRPAVAQDGGDIVFDSFDNGVVYLRMYGACSGCPSSTATLKSGIENMLKYYIPEVTEVRQLEA
jgi:Fe-S cluster biogenesis protein NfuA